jgi:hypothetical protein
MLSLNTRNNAPAYLKHKLSHEATKSGQQQSEQKFLKFLKEIGLCCKKRKLMRNFSNGENKSEGGYMKRATLKLHWFMAPSS